MPADPTTLGGPPATPSPSPGWWARWSPRSLALAADPLVHVLGGRGDVADNAVLYLRIMSIGLPFALVVLAGHGVMRGVNQLTKPLVIVAVANALNLVLEIVAVYVLHWGIAGSAWSTVVAQVLSAGWFLWIMRPYVTVDRYRRGAATARSSSPGSTSASGRRRCSWSGSPRPRSPPASTRATLAANQVVSQLFMFLALSLDAIAIPGPVAGRRRDGHRRARPRRCAWATHATRLSIWAGCSSPCRSPRSAR